MAKHVMIDLETLSLRTNASIVQIAAVAFDPETGEILSKFKAFVNESCLVGAVVGHVDINTVGWWLKQKAAPALGAALTGENVAQTPSEALCNFVDWFYSVNDPEDRGEDLVEGVWSHGATFDLPILTAAFERYAPIVPRVPWGYRLPRDTRTLYALAPGGMPQVELDESRKHDALYDCEVQVQQVVKALRELREQERLAGIAVRAGAPVTVETTFFDADDNVIGRLYTEQPAQDGLADTEPSLESY